MTTGRHRADKAPAAPLHVVRAVLTDSGVGVELSDGQVVHLCRTDEVPQVVEDLIHLSPYRDEDGDHDLTEANRAYWADWFPTALGRFLHSRR